MRANFSTFGFLLFAAVLSGCLRLVPTVEVTKTAMGYFEPTDANKVDILKLPPTRPFTEIATITVADYRVLETAQMHNALRTKSALVGAHAVILVDEGVYASQAPSTGTSAVRWVAGVAVRYND